MIVFEENVLFLLDGRKYDIVWYVSTTVGIDEMRSISGKKILC
jgi:hypothetical protein